MRVEDDDGDLAVAEDGELVGLLHQAELALCEGHLDKCTSLISLAGINKNGIFQTCLRITAKSPDLQKFFTIQRST